MSWVSRIVYGFQEDDELLVLAKQRGYQGALTLFRDLFVKVIHNVDPASAVGNNNENTTSWITRTQSDGSTSVLTLGQKVVPETLSAYRSKSHVSRIRSPTLNGTAGYVPFSVQPKGRFYAVTGSFKLHGGSAAPNVGFRVLASDQEWTDVYYDLANENLMIDRSHNSLISTCAWRILISHRTPVPLLGLTLL
jgi:beta-fructofuranosidase